MELKSAILDILTRDDLKQNEVDKVMPDYGERKEWLRVNGAGMDL
jgi:hypothetical protein